MPAALRSSLRARSMNARYWAWNTTPPASVSWKYTRTGIRNGLFNGRTADRAPPPARRAAHDRRQLVLAVELQARDDAEAVAQGVGQHAGTRGGAGKRERRQIELDRARRWALADHDVDLEVLERGVEDLLDYRRQAVNLVDEQHVPGFQIRQQGGEISRALENRPRGLAQVDPHLARDDMRERGLAQPRRAEQQHVVQRLAARARRLDEDLQLAADLLLPDILGEGGGTQRTLELLLLGGGRLARDQPVGFNAHSRILPEPIKKAGQSPALLSSTGRFRTCTGFQSSRCRLLTCRGAPIRLANRGSC